MKLIKLQMKVTVTLLTAVVIVASLAASADETGFTLEGSIRQQVFTELKANVKDLYQNGILAVPDVDTSPTARVINNYANRKSVFPVNIHTNTFAIDKAAGNID